MLFLLFFISCTPCLMGGPSSGLLDDTSKIKISWDDCSQNIDDHPCNFSLRDQNDISVSLYDFVGSPVVLDFSVMWCGPCNSAARDVQQVQDKYSESNLRYVTILIENYEGESPGSDNCEEWADKHGITSAHILQGDKIFIKR